MLFKRTVEARALFAVHFIFAGAATVSAIPIAPSIVVIVITNPVARPGGLATRLFNYRDALVTFGLVGAIQALAYFAVLELPSLATQATTISFIPGTPGVVVVIVAEVITHEVLRAT